MEEEFTHHNSIARQVAFKSVDVFEALVPNVFADQIVGKLLRPQKRRMHTDDENFFVIGAIEDANFAARGNALMGAPEIVVVQFFVAGCLERMDVATLGIDAGHHVLDGAVFSGGVHCLKNQQERPPVLRVKLFLHVTEQAYASLQDVFSMLFALDPIGVGGVVVLQPEFFPFYDAVFFDDPRRFLQLFPVFHGLGSVVQTYGSEQRAEAPSEGGETVVGGEAGCAGQGNDAIQSQNVQRVISANGDLDARHSPAELDSGGGV